MIFRKSEVDYFAERYARYCARHQIRSSNFLGPSPGNRDTIECGVFSSASGQAFYRHRRGIPATKQESESDPSTTEIEKKKDMKEKKRNEIRQVRIELPVWICTYAEPRLPQKKGGMQEGIKMKKS
jgi:hypothetical protein